MFKIIRAVLHVLFLNVLKSETPHKPCVWGGGVGNAVGNEWGMGGTYFCGVYWASHFGCHDGRPMSRVVGSSLLFMGGNRKTSATVQFSDEKCGNCTPPPIPTMHRRPLAGHWSAIGRPLSAMVAPSWEAH